MPPRRTLTAADLRILNTVTELLAASGTERMRCPNQAHQADPDDDLIECADCSRIERAYDILQPVRKLLATHARLMTDLRGYNGAIVAELREASAYELPSLQQGFLATFEGGLRLHARDFAKQLDGRYGFALLPVETWTGLWAARRFREGDEPCFLVSETLTERDAYEDLGSTLRHPSRQAISNVLRGARRSRRDPIQAEASYRAAKRAQAVALGLNRALYFEFDGAFPEL